MIIVYYINDTGDDSFILKIIRYFQNFRIFKNISRVSLEIIYKWNETVWMNTTIILKQFHAFSAHITHTKGRDAKIILLLDNFSAHECAIEKISAFYLFIIHSDTDEHVRKLGFLSKSLYPLSSCAYY
jgi:hypothetical protein